MEAVAHEAPDAVIMLDTHEDYVRGYQDRLLRLAARVDVFLPSREELVDLVGYDDPPRAVRELCTEKGLPLVIVKMGKDGVLIWDSDRSAVVPVEAASALELLGAKTVRAYGLVAEEKVFLCRPV